MNNEKALLRPLLLDDLARQPMSTHGYWARGWRRLLQNRLAVAGLVIIAAMIVVALFAPWIAPEDPSQQNLGAGQQYQSPSWSRAS